MWSTDENVVIVKGRFENEYKTWVGETIMQTINGKS